MKQENQICKCGHREKSHGRNGCCRHKGIDTNNELCPCNKFEAQEENIFYKEGCGVKFCLLHKQPKNHSSQEDGVKSTKPADKPEKCRDVEAPSGTLSDKKFWHGKEDPLCISVPDLKESIKKLKCLPCMDNEQIEEINKIFGKDLI